jgi:hypothetical protein
MKLLQNDLVVAACQYLSTAMINSAVVKHVDKLIVFLIMYFSCLLFHSSIHCIRFLLQALFIYYSTFEACHNSGLLVACPSPRRPEFAPSAVHVGFVEEKGAL